MKRNEAEKLAIKLGLSQWDTGDDDGFGGENVPNESAVKILMGYMPAPPNCPGCGKPTVCQYACQNNSCPQSNSDREPVAGAESRQSPLNLVSATKEGVHVEDAEIVPARPLCELCGDPVTDASYHGIGKCVSHAARPSEPSAQPVLTGEQLRQVALRHNKPVAGYQFADKFDFDAMAAELSIMRFQPGEIVVKTAWMDSIYFYDHLEHDPRAKGLPVYKSAEICKADSPCIGTDGHCSALQVFISDVDPRKHGINVCPTAAQGVLK